METFSSSNTICLKGGSSYITHNGNDAYRIIAGNVLVYIIPWVDERAGRRSLLCEAKKGDIIPAFAYRDMNYHDWRFCFVAVETAELELMLGMCTRPLQNRFLRRIGVSSLEQEGFENALVNSYRMNLVQEDGFLFRTGKEKRETQKQTDQLIASLFMKEKAEQKRSGGEALYQVVAELCHQTKINIAPYERIKACCGQGATIQDIARISHFPCREIVLEAGWYTADAGPLLVFWGEKREPAACIPKGRHGYILYRSGQKAIKLTKQLSEQCSPKAHMIYRPFPRSAMTGKDFAMHCIQGLSVSDLLAVLALTAVSSLIGLLLPTMNQMLYDQFVPMGNTSLILQIGGLVAAFMIGNIAFSIVRSIGAFRLNSRIRHQVQSAVYYRMFELPESFFRDYESADLAGRIMELGELASQLFGLALSMGLGIVSGTFYLYRMFTYSVPLSLVAFFTMLAFTAVSCLIAWNQQKHQKKIVALDGSRDSIMYQLLQGIEKIRIVGIEDRAVYQYMKPFVEQRRIETDMAKLSNICGVVSLIGSGILSILFYTMAYEMPEISIGQFVAFNSAFGVMSSTIGQVASSGINCWMLRPAYDRVKAVLETVPETIEGKLLPGEVTGQIDVDHISFSYSEDQPPVFADLDLHFAPGEYVGIVGSSGCGKSTLLKLLLGFERPSSGRIYYDNQDMAELDLQELRKRFGVVLQDGELISGSIFDNIILTAPQASFHEVEAAVAAVGLAEDIRSMPMGLQTVVSEHCNTISGGQKQRILIARAIISHPQIVFFDEATSALDNITQSIVCHTLEQMEATRIVIAHRLSTVQNCGRILVFDHGSIVEDGNYDALMERRGLFYELASRQLLESV